MEFLRESSPRSSGVTTTIVLSRKLRFIIMLLHLKRGNESCDVKGEELFSLKVPPSSASWGILSEEVLQCFRGFGVL